MDANQIMMLGGALLILLAGSILVLWTLDADDRMEDLRRRRAERKGQPWSDLGEN